MWMRRTSSSRKRTGTISSSPTTRREKPRVRDAVAVLESMPEFRSALTRIVVRMGTTDHPLGKWAVHHGAGTNGGVPVARAAFDHGIDTVFYIHIDAGALRRLWEAYD